MSRRRVAEGFGVDVGMRRGRVEEEGGVDEGSEVVVVVEFSPPTPSSSI